MLNVTKELTALARKLGYTGKAPDTVAKAINAITSVAGEGGSSEGCDCEPGYEVTETQLFSETVTTQDTEQGFAIGGLAYVFQSEPPATAKITFDGTDYTCSRVDGAGDAFYGGVSGGTPDFTDYPFGLVLQQNQSMIVTATEGDHTIAFSTSTLQTSADFNAAVNSVVDTSAIPMECVDGVTTFDEMEAAQQESKLMYFYDRNGKCSFIADIYLSQMAIVPDNNSISSVEIVDNIFTIIYREI